METGTVKFYNAAKGFGFVTPDNGDDLFFHVTEIKGEPPRDGDKVQFIKGEGKKGPVATQVTVKHQSFT